MVDEPFSAYRCGGSTGLADAQRTCFPFDPGRWTRNGHLKPRIVTARSVAGENRKRARNAIDRASNAPYSPAMHAELDTLEAKIRQVAELCQALRRDNIALRQQLVVAQQDNKHLTARLDEAKARLAALLQSLPEDV